MKNLKTDALILDLRHLTEETLAAYDKCELKTIIALTNSRTQTLMTQHGVEMDAVMSVVCEDDVEVSTLNGKITLDGTMTSGKKKAMVVNGKLYLKPDAGKVIDQYVVLAVNGKLYCPASLASRVAGKCIVNGKLCTYPDEAVVLNATVRLDKGFQFRAQERLYWAEKLFIAVDPKLDAAALAAKGARFASQKAILTEGNAEAMAPLFTEDTELVILPEGTAVVEDDLEMSASALRRYGSRLYVMGDVIVPENAGDVLKKLEFLHAEGSVILPAALEEAFGEIDELEYKELRLLHGPAIIGKPMLRLGKEMLELYPEGITCMDCAMVQLDAALEPDTIAKKLVFDGCAMVQCTALQQNAVTAVSKDVAQISVTDQDTQEAEKNERADVKLDALILTL